MTSARPPETFRTLWKELLQGDHLEPERGIQVVKLEQLCVQLARVFGRAHGLDRVPCGEDRHFGSLEALNLSLAGFPFREVTVGLVRKVEGRLEMLLDLLDPAQVSVDRVAALRLLRGAAAGEDEYREED